MDVSTRPRGADPTGVVGHAISDCLRCDRATAGFSISSAGVEGVGTSPDSGTATITATDAEGRTVESVYEWEIV